MNFPELIKSARESLGETQAEFAKRFETHANTVSRWESGQYQAPYEVIAFVIGDRPPQHEDCIGFYWATEGGFKMQTFKGSHGRVRFLSLDEVNRHSFQITLEKHSAKRLAEDILQHILGVTK